MSPQQIRIFVVDDQTMFRASAIAVLALQRDFQVVGQAATVSEARSLLSKADADILLLEINLAGQSALDWLPDVSAGNPRTKTIVIAATEVENEVVQAMRLGARGFLSKLCPTELFLKCIRKVHSGEIWLDGRLTQAVFAALRGNQDNQQAIEKSILSRRELEVIQLVIQGYKNRDIGAKLFISEKTVKNHLSAIFNKLGVSDRLELTLYVFEKRLFPLAE